MTYVAIKELGRLGIELLCLVINSSDRNYYYGRNLITKIELIKEVYY